MFLKPRSESKPLSIVNNIRCPRGELTKHPEWNSLSLCVYSSILPFQSLTLDALLQKVRLISQPDFGHELRQANLTIANLSGKVTAAELAEREARGKVDMMLGTIKSLEGELNDLQVFDLRLYITYLCII